MPPVIPKKKIIEKQSNNKVFLFCLAYKIILLGITFLKKSPEIIAKTNNTGIPNIESFSISIIPKNIELEQEN